MKLNKLLSGVLCVMMVSQNIAVLNVSAEETVIIPGNRIYYESFDESVDFCENAEYTISSDSDKGVLAFDRVGKIDNMLSLAGSEAGDVITKYSMKLNKASGATNNSVFMTLRAQEAGGSGVKFAYHDITKYSTENGDFSGARSRDRISIAYSDGSDDMTQWNILSMSDTMGIEDTSSRSFADYYTFTTAVVGDNAYYSVTSQDGETVSSIEADISEYDVAQKGKFYLGAQNCSAYIDEIEMYEAIEISEISIEAENMELTQGETTAFNIRVRDTEGAWHSLDKSCNSSFAFEYDSEKLMVDAENATITAITADGLSLDITAKDFYTGKTLTSSFAFEAMTDEKAVALAKDALALPFDTVDGDFTLPVSGIYNTEIIWTSSSSKVRINGENAKVIASQEDTVIELKAQITRGESSEYKSFEVLLKGIELPERDVILKGELVYSEDFDNESDIDSDIAGAIDNETIKYEDGALHIDAKGKVFTGPSFGPELSGAIAEFDAKQLGCSANSNAQFSMGLMTKGTSSYRFAYSDVSAYNTEDNTLTGATSRDRIFLGRTASSSNMGQWTLYGAGKSPIGILNRSNRSFDKYYTFSAVAAANTLLLSVMDDETLLDTVSYYNPSMKLDKGTVSFNTQSTELMLDNIRVYEAIGVRSLEFAMDEAALKPGESAEFKLLLTDGSVLDKKYYDAIEFECDGAVTIDTDKSEISADAEGEYIIKLTLRDYADERVSLTNSAILLVSDVADEIEKIAAELDITEYVENTDGIVSDFELPDSIGDAKLTWASDNSAIIINGTDAEVSRGDKNIKVILTASITLDSITVLKQFEVVVEKTYPATEAIALDYKLVDIPKRTKEDIDLPEQGRYGTEISWKSSNTSAISDDGEVRRAKENKTVKLTATFTNGEESEKYYYNVVVIGTGGSSGGSGGGGGGGSFGGSALSGITIEKPIVNVPEQKAFAFADVSADFWAAHNIYEMVNMGVVSKDTYFRPNDPITREEFVKLVVESFKLYNPAATAEFDDVSPDAWYSPYVASAVEAGIIQGVSETSFGSGNMITRQDIATIIARMLEKQGVDMSVSGNEFADTSEISDYAKDAVMSLNSMGIVTGMGDNRFEPMSNATRAQAVVMILRAIG